MECHIDIGVCVECHIGTGVFVECHVDIGICVECRHTGAHSRCVLAGSEVSGSMNCVRGNVLAVSHSLWSNTVLPI